MKFAKRIALIGSGGQLGYDLQRTFDPSRWAIFPLSHQDIEVTDLQSIEHSLKAIQPDMVINTAAFHHVDACEQEPLRAFRVNALGVRNLCLWCKKTQATLVQLSTDYVFGYEIGRQLPYKERDSVGPINVYGTSKAAGELFVASILRKYYLVRTSGLFGVAGSSGKGGNFVETMIRKGKNGEEIQVVNDQVLSPTYTKNLAEQLEMLLQTDQYGLYHITSRDACSWYEFAEAIFAELKMPINIKAISSEQSGTRAKRPAYSVLSQEKLELLGIDKMKSWQDNLHDYLLEKGHLQHGKKN